MKAPEGVQFLAPGVCIIGNYHPEGDITEVGIEEGIRRAASASSITLRWGGTVRPPRENFHVHKIMYEDEAAIKRMNLHDGWHHDVVYKDFAAMALWANQEPTEFLLPNGEIIQPQPYDIILADNGALKHRVPPVITDGRWFCRWMAELPEWLKVAR